MIYDLIIAGAGASGLMAAITAAKAGGRVLLLDQKEIPGKKLLATGNGRCNFTNEFLNDSCYFGSRRLLHAALDRFSREDLLTYFTEIGILPKNIKGCYYPNSRQAVSLQTALSCQLDRLGVDLRCGRKILRLYKEGGVFYAVTDGAVYTGKKLLIACGLLASPALGSDGSLFPSIEGFGHSFIPPMPALCGFSAKGLPFKKLDGVRTEAELRLKIDDRESRKEAGELQLTDYGISGIPVFQLSIPMGRALDQGRTVTVSIDFLPGLFDGEGALTAEFDRRKALMPEAPMTMLLCGLLPEKLASVLLSSAGLSLTDPLRELRQNKRLRLEEMIKNCQVAIQNSRDYKYAQVCSGGIPEEQVKTDLSSKLVDGLYFSGEVLDVTGICGGYNLQWAFSSGVLAASSAMEEISK